MLKCSRLRGASDGCCFGGGAWPLPETHFPRTLGHVAFLGDGASGESGHHGMKGWNCYTVVQLCGGLLLVGFIA